MDGTTRTQGKDKGTTIALWVLSIALGLVVAAGGAAKLAADPAMVALFADVGTGQWLRVLVGALEVAGGIGLLVPRARASAAAGLAVLLACATAVNVLVIDASPVASAALCGLALVLAVLRRDELPVGWQGHAGPDRSLSGRGAGQPRSALVMVPSAGRRVAGSPRCRTPPSTCCCTAAPSSTA